jgi:hypothetical protein
VTQLARHTCLAAHDAALAGSEPAAVEALLAWGPARGERRRRPGGGKRHANGGRTCLSSMSVATLTIGSSASTATGSIVMTSAAQTLSQVAPAAIATDAVAARERGERQAVGRP